MKDTDKEFVAYPYLLSCDLNSDLKVKFKSVTFKKQIDDSSSRPLEVYACAKLFSQHEELFKVDLQTRVGVETEHQGFVKVRWDEWVVFPVEYADLEEDSHLQLSVWGVGKVLLGSANLSLFNSGHLYTGSLKVSLQPRLLKSDEKSHVVAEEDDHLKRLNSADSKDPLAWLNTLSKARLESIEVEKEQHERSLDDMVLNLECSSFDFPVLFDERVDTSGHVANVNALSEEHLQTKFSSPFDWENNSLSVFFDPEVINLYNRTTDGIQGLNPVAEKYNKLTRSLIRGVVDPKLKPDQRERERIQKLIRAPDKLSQLNQDDQNLLWKFRYSLTNDKKALIKFVCSVDWNKEQEVKQAAELLRIWQEIDVVDALRLLSGEPEFRSFVVRAHAVYILGKSSDNELMQYLLQLVQALRYDSPAGVSRAAAQVDKKSPRKQQAFGILEEFLISRAANNSEFASFFNSYLMAEVANSNKSAGMLFNRVLGHFCETLQKGTPTQKRVLRSLQSQADTFKQILALGQKVNASKDKGNVRQAKLARLLSPGGECHELLRLRHPVPIPLCPNLLFTGIKPSTAKVIVSNTYPLVLDLVLAKSLGSDEEKSYRVMFKGGDDLRQDQLVLQMIGLMDNMFKKVNLDLHLTTYRVLALSTHEGMMEFVVDSYAVSKVLKKHGSIRSFFRKHNSSDNNEKAKLDVEQGVLNRFIKSCAGYCVITYILGVGDRHLDNLMLKPTGELFHIDFGYIFGRDPKAWPTQIRLTGEMIDTMGGRDSDGFRKFTSYCCQAFKVLRGNASLMLNLFHLMVDANIPDMSIHQDPAAVLLKIQDKLQLNLTDGEAETVLLNLLDQSADALAPVIYEMFHRAAIAIK